MRLTMALPIRAICLLLFVAVWAQHSAAAPADGPADATTAVDPVSKEPESVEDSKMPPNIFPSEKAVPYIPGKLRGAAAAASEAADMMKGDPDSSPSSNETDRVDHPNVKDPGTTHEEVTEGSPLGTLGSIHTCLLPPAAESEASVSDWLADGGNFTKLCSMPQDWLNSSSNGTIHVCSIPKDVWDKNYKGMAGGVLPKELLRELNDTNVTCVTPSDAMSDNSSANGTIPSAWLRDSEDNIYIYIIPREWLRKPEEEEGSTAVPSVAPAVTKIPSAGNVTSGNATSAKQTNVTVAPASQNDTKAITPANNTSAMPNSTVVPTAAPSNGTGSPNASASASTTRVAPASTEAPANGTAVAPIAIPSVSNSSSSSGNISTTTTTPTAASASAQTAKPTATTGKQVVTTAKTDAAGTAATAAPKVVSITSTASPATAASAPASTEAPKTGTRPADAENEVEGVHPATPAALSQQHGSHDHASNGKTAFLQPTESAAILAGVFVAIAILGYAGLLLWRRIIERRYGQREMLVNEDDDFDTSDMRHFEL